MSERETRAEQMRLAQARYRERHAKKLAAVHEIANILLRQSDYHGDTAKLARSLRSLMTKQAIKELCAELRAKGLK
jgi:hypothetical protein